jgi:glucose-1-phosphatase
MIRAVIFDLGNVLLNFDHRIIFDRLAAHVSSNTLLVKEKDLAKLVRSFEHGSLSPEQFYKEISDLIELDPACSIEDFRKLWAEIFWKNEELVGLLKELSKKVTLHMLSNTNEMHIEYAKRVFPELFEAFSSVTLSYKVGTSKPERAIFQKSLKLTNVKAEECLYFDDILQYVIAAEEYGIKAHQYVSVQGVRDICALYDIRI